MKPRCGFCGCLNSQHFILVFFQGAGRSALSGEEERYGDSRRRPSFFSFVSSRRWQNKSPKDNGKERVCLPPPLLLLWDRPPLSQHRVKILPKWKVNSYQTLPPLHNQRLFSTKMGEFHPSLMSFQVKRSLSKTPNGALSRRDSSLPSLLTPQLPPPAH